MAISISLDDPKEEGKLPRVQRFLDKVKATTTNFVLDEEAEFWQAHFHILGPPVVFVFNKQGKWKAFTEKDYKEHVYDAVEKQVQEWLKAN